MKKILAEIRQKMGRKKGVNHTLKRVFTGTSFVAVLAIIVIFGLYGYHDSQNSNHITRQALTKTNEQMEDVTKVVETMQSSANDMETSIMTLDSTLDEMQGNLEAIKEAVPEDADIAAKIEEIDNLSETITSIRQELSEVNAVLDTLEHTEGDSGFDMVGMELYTEAANEALLGIQDQIADITSKMITVQEDIVARKEKDSVLAAAIDSIEADFDKICDDITADINGITADMSKVNSNITDLQSSLKHTDTSLSEMQSRLDEQTTSMTSELSDINGNVADMGEEISGLQSTVTDTNSRLTTLTENVEQYRSTLSDRISSVSDLLTQNVAELKEKISGLSDDGSSIRESIVNLTACDTAMQESINTVLTDTSILQGAFDDLSSKVDQCFQSVSDGKALLASAITDKGVETNADAEFETMAEHIKQIETASKVARNGSAYCRTDWGENNFTIYLNLPGAGTYDIRVDASLLWNTGAGMAWANYHTLTIDGISATSKRVTVGGPCNIKIYGSSDYRGLVIAYATYSEVL